MSETILTGHDWYARMSPTRAVIRFHKKGQSWPHKTLRGKAAKDAAARIEGLDTALGVDLAIEGIIAEANGGLIGLARP